MLGSHVWTLDTLTLSPSPDVRDEYGVQWILMEEKGFWGSPAPEAELSPRLNQHGVYRPPAWKRERAITLTGRAYSRDFVALRTAEARVCGLLSDPRKPGSLTCHSEIGPLTCDVYLDGDILCEPLPRMGEHGIEFSLQVVAPDPRKYTPNWQYLSTTLPDESNTGLDFSDTTTGDEPGLYYGFGSETTGLLFGAGNSTGSMQLRNPGTAPTFPILTLHGPLETPSITAGNSVLRYNTQLPESETLVIDPSAPSVLLGGSASRRHLLAPADFQGFAVPPAENPDTPGVLSLGLTHLGAMTATGYLEARFRPAWF